MSKRGDIPLGASEPLPAVPGLFVDGLPLITTCMPRRVKTPRVFKFYTSVYVVQIDSLWRTRQHCQARGRRLAHYPNAEYTVEKVTKGYRLALVYSLCLPAVMRHHEKIHDVPLSEDLANAISSMDSEDDSFALVLSHEYIDTRIESVGIGALKGIDSVRFHALEEANTLVPAARKLKFFLVRLTHQADFAEGRLGHWEAERKESSSW
ncbi:hypothetical protein PC116_g4483 [Phytophthora cactorum]|nr:hypothetical protein PC111_g8554 [Phytophthora cactorum]KAG2831171.1 hypothetical protein PC112_g7383 [Phytophthora cactorum]KAG2865781.1 hypothetical protein PC113_g3407 [Phytophthora cactorum]KAG2904258.1 hypothetical protein PC114_g11913 [Phytophthora cactorum]KAG2919395.1 hypothetical protein PC115_g10158 [Phytophthora cactorum]